MNLTQTEEKLMHLIWVRERALLKDLMSDFPDPKPAKTTLATMLKRLTEKKAITFKEVGAKREYYPLVKKRDYSNSRVSKIIKNFFNNSPAELASFCTTENNLGKEELEELRDLIDSQIKKQK